MVSLPGVIQVIVLLIGRSYRGACLSCYVELLKACLCPAAILSLASEQVCGSSPIVLNEMQVAVVR